LGRIIRTTNPTRQRTLSIKKMTADIRNSLRAPNQDADLFELGAALTTSLQEIKVSVNQTAEAWEKRDYWLKADAFRRQWFWSEKYHTSISQSVVSKNLADLQKQIIELGEKLGSLKAT
jgi:hypothetical protein